MIGQLLEMLKELVDNDELYDVMARIMKKMYDSLIKAGFTEVQELWPPKAWVSRLHKSSQNIFPAEMPEFLFAKIIYGQFSDLVDIFVIPQPEDDDDILRDHLQCTLK